MSGKLQTAEHPADNIKIIAWEITRRCPLACRHCRAGAQQCAYQGELKYDECIQVMDSLLEGQSRPMIIWTGGEPMYRPDILELVAAARKRGLRSVMAPCGNLITRESLAALLDAGVMACSFSLDGATAESHDGFRGVAGAFDNVVGAMRIAVETGMPFQVNTTVSALNKAELPQIYDLAVAVGARTWDLFFLVPVGRGAELAQVALSAAESEEVIRWSFARAAERKINIRQTCAPQAVRIWHTLGREGAQPAGCMGGRGFVFISHTGILQPCGFLDVPSGDLRTHGFDLCQSVAHSAVFANLNSTTEYGGSCGSCVLHEACGGCRARAYAASGDYMAAEPACCFNLT